MMNDLKTIEKQSECGLVARKCKGAAPTCSVLIACIVGLSFNTFPSHADEPVRKNSSGCTLTSSGSRILSPQSDRTSAHAHRVFNRLLRAWDNDHLPPKLTVLQCGGRVFALSQANGHILITDQAVKLSLGNRTNPRDGPLAFVLAHELVHQLHDFSTPRPPPTSPFVESIVGKERERLADAYAVVLMALAGFDPYEVAEDRDFFKRWTESGLGGSCDAPKMAAQCADARQRAQAIQSNIYRVAEHAVLFEFGLQSFAIGRYDEAISAFEQFGRVFRSAQASFNLGLAHLARAIQLDTPIETHASPTAKRPLVLPSIVASASGFPPSRSVDHGVTDGRNAAQRRRYHIDHAIEAFLHVIRVQPTSAPGYAYLIFSYLVGNQLSMASGVWNDQYPRDARDAPLARFISALLDVAGNHTRRAQQHLRALNKNLRSDSRLDPAMDMLRYVVSQQLSLLARADSADKQAIWTELANWARGRGRTLLFQLAVMQLNPGIDLLPAAPIRHTVPWRIGSNIETMQPALEPVSLTLTVNDTPLSLLSPYAGTVLLADPNSRLHHYWITDASRVFKGTGMTIDELLAYYGPPDRHVSTETGQYLAYTRRGVGFRVIDEHISSAFHFSTN